MSLYSDDHTLKPLASELVVRAETDIVCETYLFEPATEEATLGRLYAVGETPVRDGVGTELLDMVVQALQREYYREPNRGILASFESALHQANLILHDASERGFRDWMQHFNVAIGVLAGSSLHISTAGFGAVYLVRRNRVTLISEELAQLPLTNPLRTFSQVASGTLSLHDVLYWSAQPLSPLFRHEDLVRFAGEDSAATIAQRLQQLYEDQHAATPLAALAVKMVPQLTTKKQAALVVDTTDQVPARERALPPLTSRQPLIIHRSFIRVVGLFIARACVWVWQWLREVVWPLVRRGSAAGGRLAVASATSTRNWRTFKPRWGRDTATTVPHEQTFIPRPPLSTHLRGTVAITRSLPQQALAWLRSLPTTSKIFAAVAVVLGIVLVISLVLLQSKRTEDADIQRASEILHNARTNTEAAEAALIYDNRDQAQTLLEEADRGVTQLLAEGLYQSEAEALRATITATTDRLHRVVRASTVTTTPVGDFAELLEGSPTRLLEVADQLYTFDPGTNSILRLDPATGEATTVQNTTEGVGFFTAATTHQADKTLIFMTDAPGVALYDARNATLVAQDIVLPTAGESVRAIAPYGSRLYIFSEAADQIMTYSKTLRGFVNPTPWITDDSVPHDTIVDIAIDGTVYTLHTDGAVRALFKGVASDVRFEPATPPLAGATRIVTNEGLTNIYVFDPVQKRVAIYTKKGALKQQLYLDVAEHLTDIAVAADETALYMLDGTRVVKVPLT